MKQIRSKHQRGFTMLELLCCIAIILILVGLMMGPVMKAWKRAKKLTEEVQ